MTINSQSLQMTLTRICEVKEFKMKQQFANSTLSQTLQLFTNKMYRTKYISNKFFMTVASEEGISERILHG